MGAFHMYHTEKIGVFISHIMGHYQKNVCQGIINMAQEYGYCTEIFTTLDGEDLGDYGIGEENILHLPDYNEYDGIIFASDTYPCEELKTQIRDSLLKACSCPVIEITAANRSFPTVVLENNSMTAELVAHLAKVHHCKRICYLGCESQRFFSDSREQYYRSAMGDAGLTVEDNDVCICAIEESAIAEALAFFTADGTHPDAIVCYNDDMALMLMQTAIDSGYRIPEDMAITGCDHTTAGQNAIPSLTTVTFPVYELGTRAVDLLIQTLRGDSIPDVTYVKAAAVYAGSCGCQEKMGRDVVAFQQSLNRRIASLESAILESIRMSAAASHITELDEGMDLIEHYIQGIEHCREFYLCLYADWDSVSSSIRKLTAQDADTEASSGETLLALAIRDGKRLPSCSFMRRSPHALLPEHICRQSAAAYIYTPLFFEDKEFGYIALSYKDNQIEYHFQLVHWFSNINRMLHGICEAKCNHLMLHHLETIYTKDMLTGLYNRHGYLQKLDTLIAHAVSHGEDITCFLFDLDGLKQINDTYGHAEGDFALQVIGQALSHVTRENDICAHFSGDEFYLVASGCTKKDADDLLAHVNEYLTNYNRLSTRKYTISVSGGYASAPAAGDFSSQDIDALFSQADQQMYQRKHAKKNMSVH